jgi:outer membrane protein assembly factor BamB
MIRTGGWLIPLALVAAAAHAQAAPGDWPTFLGPDHNGISRETGLLKQWPGGGPPVVWREDLGETYSAPSIARGTLVLFHRVGDEEVVEAADPATGKRRWRHAAPTAYSDRYNYCGGPRAAPTIDGERVYTLGAEGRLTCLELATGKLVWTRSLHAEYFGEPRQNFFGVGVAPRIIGEAIFLNLGDERTGCVTAIDKAGGKTLWRAGGDGAGYATATPADVGASRQVIFLTRQGGLCCDRADGTILWNYPFRSRAYESANAATPLVIGDAVLLTASYGVGSALLKLEERGFKEVWRNRALGAHFATPIHRDGFLYGFDGRHDEETALTCVRLSDGKVVWSEPGYGWGSMTWADDKFIILKADGRLILADLTPAGYREISSVQLLSPDCWPAPVLSRGLLYVMRFDHRTRKATIVCLDLREKK